MKLSIILLVVGLCVVSAKYLPEEWDNSGQFLSRFKRFDLGDSDASSEGDDESDSKDDDSDNSTDETDVKEQSKRVANLERMRQKLLEKQEKERLKQEEAQRKIEEKIAKELQKEEEKREKEQRKWEEKLEKERRKLEEEQRKIQEKIEENERKRQEKIQKEIEEREENKKQESDVNSNDDSDDDSIELEDIWKIHIYSKYGITEENTNVEKKAALRKYMQEELGLNANSTQSERRQAVLRFIQSELQKVPNINILRSQFIDYINYVGVQKIRTKLEGDIEKLKNKTENLNNVNFAWVPIARQNLAEQVSFLETIKQFLSNLLPNWSNGNTDKPQEGLPATNADSVITLDSSILTQQTNDANPTNTVNTNNDVSPSKTEDNVPNSSLPPTTSSVGADSSLNDLEKPKSPVVDEANPTSQVSTVSEANSQTTSVAGTNGPTITGNEQSVSEKLPSETGSDIVEGTKTSINELKPIDVTNESAQTGSSTNADVNGSVNNEKPSIATDNVNNVSTGGSPAITPTELQGSPSIAGASASDSTNQNVADDVNVDAINKNTDSASENTNNAVSDAGVAVTITDGAVSSASIPSSDLDPVSSQTSNNENAGTASSIVNNPTPDNVDVTVVDSNNVITDTVSESSPSVDNGVLSSGLPGSDITEASLTSVASDYIAPSVNTLDVSSIASEGSNNGNSVVTENSSSNIITDALNTEASENPSTSNGNQTQVIIEATEVITQGTIVNESSSVVNQEQSNSENGNTEKQIINEIIATVTEQILTAERVQDVSIVNDLITDSVTQETPVNPPVPVDSGATVVDVAQQ